MASSRTSTLQQITVAQMEANLGPYITEKPSKVKSSDIVIGARVQLRGERTGIIRYIDDDDNNVIGIQLDSRNHKGHAGKGCFEAPIGRGYFAKRSHVVAVGKSSVSQKKHHRTNKFKLEKITMFDTVILQSGERGRVVFIGNVHFGTEKMLGIELEKWSPNGHNGSIYGKTYFVVREGHGLLVPLEAIYDVNRERQHNAMYANNTFIECPIAIVPLCFVSENRLGPQSDEEDDDLKRADDSKSDDDSQRFHIGDKVRVQSGEIGVVPYIHVSFLIQYRVYIITMVTAKPITVNVISNCHSPTTLKLHSTTRDLRNLTDLHTPQLLNGLLYDPFQASE